MTRCIYGNKTCDFTYGPDGLRRTKTVTLPNNIETKTYYLVDGKNVAQEYRDLNNDSTIGTNEAVTTYVIGSRGTEGRTTGDQEDPEFASARCTQSLPRSRLPTLSIGEC